MNKHIVIIGHGAIGLLWAHHLTATNHRVTLISRHKQLPESAQRFTNYQEQQGVHELAFAHALPHDADLLLVTTKSYQVAHALSPLLEDVTVPIILLHNGMGAVDELALAAHHKVILATTTHGALHHDNLLKHTGMGHTVIGNYQHVTAHELNFWRQLLNEALPPVNVHHNISQPLLLKLAINCIINPLTAIEQCKNGDLLATKYQSQIGKLIFEVQQVISHLDNTWPYTEQSLEEIIYDVIKATAENYSSMAQDVKFGRKTEIDYINGYLVRCGESLLIDVNEHKKLLVNF